MPHDLRRAATTAFNFPTPFPFRNLVRSDPSHSFAVGTPSSGNSQRFIPLTRSRRWMIGARAVRSCGHSYLTHPVSRAPCTRLLHRIYPFRHLHTTTWMASTEEWPAVRVRDTFMDYFNTNGHTFGEQISALDL